MKNYENNYKDTKFAQRNKGIIFVQKESNKLKKMITVILIEHILFIQ